MRERQRALLALPICTLTFSCEPPNERGPAEAATPVETCEPRPVLTIAAGAIGGPGYADRRGGAARLGQARDVTVGADGELYFADVLATGSSDVGDFHVIRRAGANGKVTTVAGTRSQASGWWQCDGPAAEARFQNVTSLTADAEGNLYVAEELYDQATLSYGLSLRRIAPDGEVRSLFGAVRPCSGGEPRPGLLGDALPAFSGIVKRAPSGDFYVHYNVVVAGNVDHGVLARIAPGGMLEPIAEVGTPSPNNNTLACSFAFTDDGKIVLADTGNHVILEITPDGTVTTLAGSAGEPGHANGTGAEARFTYPAHVAIDAAGNVFVADSAYAQGLENRAIRRIAPDGTVTTVRGSADLVVNGIAADADGRLQVAASLFGGLTAIGAVYVITPEGKRTTLAGGVAAHRGSTDGPALSARFEMPAGIDLDPAGNLYISDRWNRTIRKLTPQGQVSTVTGAVPGPPGSGGPWYVDGPAADARFQFVNDLAFDAASGSLYMADAGNSALRKLDASGIVSTVWRAESSSGGVFMPSVDVLPNGDVLLIAEPYENAVYRVTPAGDASVFASIPYPTSLTVTGDGSVFVSDEESYVIHRIAANGTVTVVAGTPGQSGTRDGGPGEGQIGRVVDMASDAQGNVYFTQLSWAPAFSLVRRLGPNGEIETVVGDGVYAGVALGPLDKAGVNLAYGLAVAPNALYVSEFVENAILRISPRP